MEKTSGFKKFASSKLFTLLLMLVILVVLFTILTKGSFLTLTNIRNILNTIVIVSFLAIGEGMLIIYGNIDLSVGYLGTIASCVMALAITNAGLPWFVGYILAFIVGIIGGLLNAFMINELNFQPFIATLGMSSVCQGLTMTIVGGMPVKVNQAAVAFIGTAKIFGGAMPFNIIIALVFLIIYGIILAKTQFGRTIYLCGGNKAAARLCGLNPKKLSYILFANSGFLAAVSGCIFASRQKNATVTGISGQQFSGITAAILGGISFGGGSGNMFGCFIGMLILNCFNNGMTCIGVNTYIQQVFSGALLIVALMLDFISQKSQARAVMKRSMSGAQ